MNHLALSKADKSRIRSAGLAAIVLVLVSVSGVRTQAQILPTGSGQQDQQRGQTDQGTTGQRTPFPIVPERSKVNIVNAPGDPSMTRESAPPTAALPIAPDPDIEFQEYVASSLGYGLRIFGQSLFENVPTTFAPLNYVPVAPDYLIGPGDELLIRGWGQIDINYHGTIDPTGAIYLTNVGAINVAGLRYDQLNDYLKHAIGRYYKDFNLDVTLGRLRAIQIFVVGQVRRPGTYTVSSLSTLINALFASGGPSKRGSMRQIQLKRGGRVITTFDLYDLMVKGDKSQDASLMPGDVIYVPAVGRLVAMSGSVNLPAIYELKDRDTLGNAVNYAGGLASTAAGQRVMIERIDARQVRKAEEVPLTPEGLNQELQDGDIVRVLHISPRFENAVVLRGNVALPGRYPWRDGMTVKDLIPTRESLVTEEYWKQQNLLGWFPANETFLTDSQRRLFAAQVQTAQSQQIQAEQAAAANAYARNNLGAAAPTGVYPPAIGPSGQGIIPAITGANLAGAAQGGQTGVLGDQNLQQSVGRVEAERIHQEELKNQIKRSAAEINWEYAVIQRLDPSTLTSHLFPFNLGKAIAGDSTQNLVLQRGDIITIFSQADLQVPIAQQSKFVRLEGEFGAAGIYQAEPGETLRHLLTRVTSLTAQAYLFGSEFTRESVREDLQRRLDDYVGGLEREVGTVQAITPQDQAALAVQRQMVERLKQLRSTGRIVLQVKPDATSVGSFPDITLEDGDRLFIPFRPATVSVVGAVYNSNAFLYRPGYSVADYLRLAGGATRDGDKRHEFVLRANGSTVSKAQHSNLVVNNFNSLRLLPGDTIIVPQKIGRGAVLQGLKDWSQLFQQFALGAAGISVLLP